jgi:Uma2 family endonuclease
VPTKTAPARTSRESGPAWDVARLFPDQGQWDDGDYLVLTRNVNSLVEFTDGRVEVLPMPTTSHQLAVQYLSNRLLAFVTPRELGLVLFAPLRVRLRKGKFREPDVVFMLAEHADRAGEEFWDRADLVMEVVSDEPEDRHRDLVTKRADYARAGIPEYWIVDPRERRITVLRLVGKGKRYVVHGEFGAGGRARSALLEGFEVEVDKVFRAALATRQ